MKLEEELIKEKDYSYTTHMGDVRLGTRLTLWRIGPVYRLSRWDDSDYSDQEEYFYDNLGEAFAHFERVETEEDEYEEELREIESKFKGK